VVTSPGCEIVDGKTPYCTTNHDVAAVSAAGALPDTGGTSALVLLLGMLMLSLGGYIVIRSRRDTEAALDR
jgi:LPXTG-motif cell wall-anchored protein